MSRPIVTLRPLTRTDLAAITPCLEHPETRRYLGGPEGPAAMLARPELAFVELSEAGGRGGPRPPPPRMAHPVAGADRRDRVWLGARARRAVPPRRTVRVGHS